VAGEWGQGKGAGGTVGDQEVEGAR
jgi:hypothetical protein